MFQPFEECSGTVWRAGNAAGVHTEVTLGSFFLLPPSALLEQQKETESGPTLNQREALMTEADTGKYQRRFIIRIRLSDMYLLIFIPLFAI